MTIFRSEPEICGLFFSQAMKCWRIQYYERGMTYHYSRESSFYIERLEDAERIASLVPGVKSWEQWKEMVEIARLMFRDKPAIGYVFVNGITSQRECIDGRKR